MSDAYQDKDLQSIEKDKGQILSSVLQSLAMLTALVKKPRVKAEVKPPQQPQPPPPAQRPSGSVKDDLIYIEAQRKAGVPDEQIKLELQQRSSVQHTTQQRFDNGDQYLDQVMELAHRTREGKFPTAGLATKQTNKQNLGR